MADNHENQTTQPNELRPPGGEPQLEWPEDASMVDAGELKRGKGRHSSRQRKADSFTWITAAIGVIAALAGVLTGAFVTYYMTRSQANTQGSAATIAKANTDLINKRQKDYADYLKNERNLVNSENLLVGVLRNRPSDFVALGSAKDKWTKDGLTTARSNFILSFNDSDKADDIREEISHQTGVIREVLTKLIDQAYAHESIDQPSLQELDAMFAVLQSQFDRFTDQARADLRSPNGGLPS
jgi:hypothetical protein